jgi:hypothetical protein
MIIGARCGQGASRAVAAQYSTNFQTTETPLAENGRWLSGLVVGLDWTSLAVSGGKCFGTQPTPGGADTYDDSMGILNPAHPIGIQFLNCSTITTKAVIYNDQSLSGNTHEVEILNNYTFAAHSIAGYEVNYAFDASYTEIVQWLGPIGSYTPLRHTVSPSFGVLQTGDIFEVVRAPTTISVFVTRAGTRTQIDTTFDLTIGNTVTPLSGGTPGLGMWHSDSAAHYCFSSWQSVGIK